MATRWTITFKTVNNSTCVVSIGDPSYSGSARALTPALHPFSLTCKKSEIHSEIMSETGYLRIMDNGVAADAINDIHPIGALDRPVQIAVGGTLVWRGYISAESYSTDYSPAPVEVQLPVVGLLEAMSSANITNNGVALNTIGNLLAQCLDASGQSWDYVIFPRQMTEIGNYSDAPEMRLSISRYNWLHLNDSYDNTDQSWTPYLGDSFQTILSDICRYFGWTASTEGRDLILTSPRTDVDTYRRVSVSDLRNIGSSSISYSNVSRQAFSPTWDGINHSRSIKNGYKRITLESDLNIETDAMPEIKFSGNLVRTFDKHFDIEVPQGEATYQDEHFGCRMQVLDTAHESVTLYQPGEPYWECPTDINDMALPGGYIVRACTFKDDEVHANYSYRNLLRLSADVEHYGPHYNLDQRLAKITGRGVGVFAAGGALALNATVYNSYASWKGLGGEQPAKDDVGLSTWGPFNNWIRMSLRVGNKWWNGTNGWMSSEGVFRVKAGNHDGEHWIGDVDETAAGSIINQKTLSMPWEGATGYLIPITETMVGDIEINFFTWEKNTPHTSGGYDFTAMFIGDINMRYYSDAAKTGSEGIRLSASTGRQFLNELKLSLALTSCTDSRIGHAALWYNGATVGRSTALSYIGSRSYYQPEKWLLDTLKKVYSKPSESLDMEVTWQSSLDNFEYMSMNSKTYIIMGKEIDFADEHMTLTVLSYD